jgi:hypothetical protein
MGKCLAEITTAHNEWAALADAIGSIQPYSKDSGLIGTFRDAVSSGHPEKIFTEAGLECIQDGRARRLLVEASSAAREYRAALNDRSFAWNYDQTTRTKETHLRTHGLSIVDFGEDYLVTNRPKIIQMARDVADFICWALQEQDFRGLRTEAENLRKKANTLALCIAVP